MEMAENHVEEAEPPMVTSIASLLSSQDDPTVDSAYLGTPVINRENVNDEMIGKDYEALSNMTDILVQDLDGAKLASCADESKPLAGDLVSEKSDVCDAAVSTSSPNNEKSEVNITASEHDKKGGGGILTSGVQNLPSSIVSKEPGVTKKGLARIQLSSHRPSVVRQPESPQALTLSSSRVKQVDAHRALVDTASHIGSVRDVVTMFGGSADWRAHKRNTIERLQLVDGELAKVEKEVPESKKALKIAEKEQQQVLQELESTKKQIEELKAKLEKAQIEEEQAKQDSEFAQTRVEEIKKGINDEASIAAKAELDTAKARHETAMNELASVKDELEILKRECLVLVEEKEKAVRKADDAISTSKETERTVEQLTLELMSTKESLELAYASHLEAEEKRAADALARDQELLKQEEEMKEAEEEIQRLTEQLSSTKDRKAKLETASALLNNLKDELTAYMNENMNLVEDKKLLTAEIEAKQGEDAIVRTVDSTVKELEEVRAKIGKARDEVKSLRIAALSLKSELEGEKLALANTRQREGITAVTVTALEAELIKTRLELEAARTREKKIQESMMEMPESLQRAAQEADQAKLSAQNAREDLHRIKEEVELAKASARTAESRLHAAVKEIEAANASHKLALAAIKALNDNTTTSDIDDQTQTSRVTLSLSDYFKLGEKSHEADELAKSKVLAAISEIEAVKEDEQKSMDKLDAANQELTTKREELNVAKQKAESAIEGKLGVEQELRMWRAQLEQRRKAANSAPDVTINSPMSSPKKDTKERKELMSLNQDHDSKSASVTNVEDLIHDSSAKKKKRSLLPKIVMLLTRKRDTR